MSVRLAWRKSLNVFMLSLTGVCVLLTVSVLFFILGFLVYNGGKDLSWSFFTRLPAPVGEEGGGMANAILGSLKLLLLAALFGVPIGLLGGVYLAEFGGRTIPFIVRYTADLLNGVPSIVIGIFAYALVVMPMHHFSTLAGGFALGIMVIPTVLRNTESFLTDVPRSLREGAFAHGREQVEDGRDGRASRSLTRNSDGRIAGPGARSGRDSPAALHRIRQSVLEPRLESADVVASGRDIHLRDRSLRGLASAGVGGGTGTARNGAGD